MHPLFLPRALSRAIHPGTALSGRPIGHLGAPARRIPCMVTLTMAALVMVALLWFTAAVTAQTLDEELTRNAWGDYDQGRHIEPLYPGEPPPQPGATAAAIEALPTTSQAAYPNAGPDDAFRAYPDPTTISEGRIVGRPAPPYTAGQQPVGPTAQASTGVAISQSAPLTWGDTTAFDRDPRAKTIRRLIEDSASTLDTFLTDGNYEPMWRLVQEAKALVIIPRLIQGGFVFGGSGGNAIVISRLPDGGWSHPTFFTMGSASFGLQIGAEFSQTVLFAMTDRGRNQFLQSTVKLGGDVGVAAGPYGVGAKAQTTDILAFSRSRGLYGGISIEGSVLKRRTEWNKLYYGNEQITSADILIRNSAGNPHSRPIHEAANRLVTRGASLPPYGAGRR